jgi:hypothetical protein
MAEINPLTMQAKTRVGPLEPLHKLPESQPSVTKGTQLPRLHFPGVMHGHCCPLSVRMPVDHSFYFLSLVLQSLNLFLLRKRKRKVVTTPEEARGAG